MAAILNSGHHGFGHLSCFLSNSLTLARIGSHYLHKKDYTHISLPTICPKNTLLIHSDSTWWWQLSWILPCWIKKLYSFILTQLDDGSHLEFCHVGFRHLVFFSQIHSKTLSLHSDFWLKLIQSDSNLFILTQLDDGSHLEFCHLEFGLLGFSHLSFSSQTHSHLPRLVPTICTKKTFTHLFWLNLMMGATLNSTMLDSDTAILDSDTFLSSLGFTQKHSPSTLILDSN